MSAKVYDLFVEDPFSGVKQPNIHQPEEFMVVSGAGAEAIFSTMGEAAGFYAVQELDPTRRVVHLPAIAPIERIA